MQRSDAVGELQMLTGVMAEDIDYLVYLLIKDGSYFKEERKGPICKSVVPAVEDLNEWFKKI